MNRKVLFSALGYTLVSMIWGMSWHFMFFKNLYHELGAYSRPDPIIPLGLASMLIQGFVLAYLFQLYRKGMSPIVEGLKFSMVMGLFLFSVSTLAFAAKSVVTSMTAWMLVQSGFHLVQFAATGVILGLVFGKDR